MTISYSRAIARSRLDARAMTWDRWVATVIGAFVLVTIGGAVLEVLT